MTTDMLTLQEFFIGIWKLLVNILMVFQITLITWVIIQNNSELFRDMPEITTKQRQALSTFSLALQYHYYFTEDLMRTGKPPRILENICFYCCYCVSSSPKYICHINMVHSVQWIFVGNIFKLKYIGHFLPSF